MALASFLLWSVAGSALWVFALAVLGYGLHERYDRVSAWLDPVSLAILAASVLGYCYRLVARRAHR